MNHKHHGYDFCSGGHDKNEENSSTDKIDEYGLKRIIEIAQKASENKFELTES